MKKDKDLEHLTYLAELMKIGKVWSNYGYHRIYFDVTKLINLKQDKGRTTLNGLELIEPDAKNVENACLNGKLWYDINKKKFDNRSLHIENYDLEKMAMDAIAKLLKPELFLEDELFEI